MIGLGTIINTAAIIAGGILGMLLGRFLNERIQDTLLKTCGLATLFIALGGVVTKMVSLADDGTLSAGKSLLIIICLALGGLIGELINIEGLFEKFGNWLKVKTKSTKDNNFTNGFLTATFTVCIGAMAVIGAINDGINGDFSVLLVKAILDFIIIMIMSCSLGKGCLFSAIPVFIIQFSITLLAKFIAPVLTDGALNNLSLIGNILIFCVGINLIWEKKIRVANLLPSIVLAIGIAYIPIDL